MLHTKNKINSVEISAVITRADGTVEDLGIITASKKQGKIGAFVNRIRARQRKERK